MSELLFTTPCAEPVPKVTFEFVDECDIPGTPPPIYDCGGPTCPPIEIPPFCPDITGGKVKVTVKSKKADCGELPDAGGTFTVRKTENCEFDIGLDLTIPIITPPCPIINGGKVNVKARYGDCDPTPDSKIRVTPRPAAPCDDGACEFDIDLDITIDIPTPPCPKINGGKIKVTSGYGQCGGDNDGKIRVVQKPVIDKCGDTDCEFDISAEINVVVPFPVCPQFSKNVGTAKTPSFDIRQVSSPDCGDDGNPCAFEIDIKFPEVPPVPCPEIKGGNISIAFSQANQAYGSINVRPVKPVNPDDICSFEVTGQLVIPSPPPIYPPNNPGGGGSNKPCIPKYSGGAIKITGNCGGTGTIKVGMSQAQKNQTDPYCVYCNAMVPVNNVAGSCLITTQTGFAGELFKQDCYTFGVHSSVNNCEDCARFGGKYECFPQSNNCGGYDPGYLGGGGTALANTADDRSAVVIPVEWECQGYACENFADQGDPEAACAALGGTLRIGPCSGGGVSQSSCQDLEITAEINLDGDCGGTNNPDDPDDPSNDGCGPLPEGGEVTVNGKSAGKLIVKKSTDSDTSSPGASPPVDPDTLGWCLLPSGECSRRQKAICEDPVTNDVNTTGFGGKWYPEEVGGCTEPPSSSTTAKPCYTITAELNIPGVDMEGSSSSSGGGGGGGGGGGCVPKGGRIQADGKDVGSINIDEEDTPDTNDTGSCRIRGDCLSGYARGTCEEEGGEWFSSGDCSESAPCYKITADISLKDALGDSLEFEKGEQNYNKGDCDTEPSVSVEIKRGDDGKYKINTTLSFPDLKKCCCSIKEDAEVENPGAFES